MDHKLSGYVKFNNIAYNFRNAKYKYADYIGGRSGVKVIDYDDKTKIYRVWDLIDFKYLEVTENYLNKLSMGFKQIKMDLEG